MRPFLLHAFVGKDAMKRKRKKERKERIFIFSTTAH
jgi:hypothetical protein